MKPDLVDPHRDPHRALRMEPERPPRAELHDALALAAAAAVALLAGAAGALPSF